MFATIASGVIFALERLGWIELLENVY